MKNNSKKKKTWKRGRRNSWFKFSNNKEKKIALANVKKEVKYRNKKSKDALYNIYVVSLPLKGDIAFYVGRIEHVKVLENRYDITNY